jgi:DNA (cytosine-5)-methyltransferase 1
MPGTHERQTPRFLDVFCGIGGLGLGLHQAGMSPAGGVDCWEDVQATFERNHPGVKFLRADVNCLSLRRMETELAVPAAAIDVVVGGPPCQGSAR